MSFLPKDGRLGDGLFIPFFAIIGLGLESNPKEKVFFINDLPADPNKKYVWTDDGIWDDDGFWID